MYNFRLIRSQVEPTANTCYLSPARATATKDTFWDEESVSTYSFSQANLLLYSLLSSVIDKKLTITTYITTKATAKAITGY